MSNCFLVDLRRRPLLKYCSLKQENVSGVVETLLGCVIRVDSAGILTRQTPTCRFRFLVSGFPFYILVDYRKNSTFVEVENPFFFQSPSIRTINEIRLFLKARRNASIFYNSHRWSVHSHSLSNINALTTLVFRVCCRLLECSVPQFTMSGMDTFHFSGFAERGSGSKYNRLTGVS